MFAVRRHTVRNFLVERLGAQPAEGFGGGQLRELVRFGAPPYDDP